MVKHVYLIRHGEPETGFTKRYLGRLDPGLSPHGREQAGRLAARLAIAPPERIIASPLLRAAETAEIIAATCERTVETDDTLLEINFGKLEGMTFQEASSIFPDATDSWQALAGNFSFPGGETFADFSARATAAADMIRAFSGASIALVAHGGILRGILCDLLAVEADGPLRFRLAYAALTILDIFPDGGAVLTGFNIGREAP